MSVRLTQGKPAENRRARGGIRHTIWIGGLLVALLFLADGIALAFLIHARTQSERLADGALPRAVAAERLAVDASHLTALTAELPAAGSAAERQTALQRIDGLRAALRSDVDMLRQAGIAQGDYAAIVKTEEALLDGADAMNSVAQSGIDLRGELERQRDRARTACEARAASKDCQEVLWALAGSGPTAPLRDGQPELRVVAVLQRDLAVNEQHRINLLRRQSETAARFLALAGGQSEAAADEMRRQQREITDWVALLEWGLAGTLAVTALALARLATTWRRRHHPSRVLAREG